MIASIIIPAYNCAAWLDRSVSSAYSLDATRVEVIVVDDGSTDETQAICTSLKYRYPGLKVISQPNGGLSAARNAGIDSAVGTFVILLDADDQLVKFDLTPLETFQGDILRIGVEEVSTNGEAVHWCEPSSPATGGKIYLNQRLIDRTIYIPSWAYIYRRSFLNENNLRFTVGLIHEDMLFTIQALIGASAVASTDAVLYRYFRREGSITLQKTYAASKRRILSFRTIVRDLLTLANHHSDVDLWLWITHVIDYAWYFACQAKSRRLSLGVLQLELILLLKYQGWGNPRSRRSELWRLRRAVHRLVHPNP